MHKYSGGAAIGHSIYFAPSSAWAVGIFDTRTNTFATIPIPESETFGLPEDVYGSGSGFQTSGVQGRYIRIGGGRAGEVQNGALDPSVISVWGRKWSGGFGGMYLDRASVNSSFGNSRLLVDVGSKAVIERIVVKTDAPDMVSESITVTTDIEGLDVVWSGVFQFRQNDRTVWHKNSEWKSFKYDDQGIREYAFGLSYSGDHQGYSEYYDQDEASKAIDPCGLDFKFSGAAAVGTSVIFAPYNVNAVGIFRAGTATFSAVPIAAGVEPALQGKYSGAAAVRSNVYFAPSSFLAPVGIFDAVTEIFSFAVIDGFVYDFTPHLVPAADVFRPAADVFRNPLQIDEDEDEAVADLFTSFDRHRTKKNDLQYHSKASVGTPRAFAGAAASGNSVYFAPFHAPAAGVFDTETNNFTWAEPRCDLHRCPETGLGKFSGAAASPKGGVYFAPYGSAKLGMVDTTNNEMWYSTETYPSFSPDDWNEDYWRLSYGAQYSGAVTVGDAVYFAPFDLKDVGVCRVVGLQRDRGRCGADSDCISGRCGVATEVGGGGGTCLVTDWNNCTASSECASGQCSTGVAHKPPVAAELNCKWNFSKEYAPHDYEDYDSYSYQKSEYEYYASSYYEYDAELVHGSGASTFELVHGSGASTLPAGRCLASPGWHCTLGSVSTCANSSCSACNHEVVGGRLGDHRLKRTYGLCRMASGGSCVLGNDCLGGDCRGGHCCRANLSSESTCIACGVGGGCAVCAAGLYATASGTCSRLERDGGSCVWDGACATGACLGGKCCGPDVTTNCAECGSAGHCEVCTSAAFFVKNGQCSPKLANGAECEMDMGCISGSCRGGRCCNARGQAPACTACDPSGNCAACLWGPSSLTVDGRCLVEECNARSCNGNGKCADVRGSVSCDCDPGWIGERCETNRDDCAGQSCSGHGTCKDHTALTSTGLWFKCECFPGYDGVLCGDNIDDCEGVPCSDHGTCVDGVASYTCDCEPGYTGLDCDTVVLASEGGGDGDNSTAAVIGAVMGVLVLILLLVTATFKYRAYRSRMQAVDFERELSKLKEMGQLEPSRSGVPREIKRGHVAMVNMVGEGQFGEVWKGMLDESSKPGGVPAYMCAVKTSKETQGEGANELIREGTIMAQVPPHRNLVALIGMVTSGAPLLMLLSYCELGSLLSYVRGCRDAGKSLQPVGRVQFGVDIAEGLVHLASHNFVHRDLAARNVLLDATMVCKVADFGLSRVTAVGSGDEKASYYKSQNGTFPIRWTSPEAMMTLKFTQASDVWSFGITMIEIFTDGDEPYPELLNAQIPHAVATGTRCERPPLCGPEIYELLLRCWAKLPGDRPSFGEIVAELNSHRRSFSFRGNRPDFVARRSSDVHGVADGYDVPHRPDTDVHGVADGYDAPHEPSAHPPQSSVEPASAVYEVAAASTDSRSNSHPDHSEAVVRSTSGNRAYAVPMQLVVTTSDAAAGVVGHSSDTSEVSGTGLPDQSKRPVVRNPENVECAGEADFVQLKSLRPTFEALDDESDHNNVDTRSTVVGRQLSGAVTAQVDRGYLQIGRVEAALAAVPATPPPVPAVGEVSDTYVTVANVAPDGGEGYLHIAGDDEDLSL